MISPARFSVIFRKTVLLLSVLLLSSCSQSPASDPETLLLNLGAEPSLINPILSTDSASSKVEGFVFSGLMRVNQSLEMVPDLAERYEISEDHTEYTFFLRKNIRWHDGQAFTAQDVKFTFDTILNPNTNTVRRSNYMIGGKPVQFTVLDDHTLRAKLPRPFSPFLIHMGMGILPQHLLQGKDINTDPFNRNPVGTGPFSFVEWRSGQFVKLSRNQAYYGDSPKIKNILLKIIPDERTALIALEKRELDTSAVPKKDVKKYQNNEDVNLFQYEDLIYTFMAFNLENPHFKGKEIREAIAYAIDKDAIVQGVLKGHGKAAHIPDSPVSWSYPNSEAIQTYDYDPKKSQVLIEKAGFIFNPETKLYEKNGEALEFTLITNKGNKDREKSAQIIQRFLKNVGISMNIQLMEWSSFIKILNEPTHPKKFDAVILGWSLGLDPDAYSIWHSSQYPKGFNFVNYNNSSVDSLIEKGRILPKRSQRKPLYRQLYQEIAQDLPYIFLYYPEVIVAYQKRVKGLSPPGPAGLMNPIENVYLEE